MSDRIIDRKLKHLSEAFNKVSVCISNGNYTDALVYLYEIDNATRDIRQEIGLKRETDRKHSGFKVTNS